MRKNMLNEVKGQFERGIFTINQYSVIKEDNEMIKEWLEGMSKVRVNYTEEKAIKSLTKKMKIYSTPGVNYSVEKTVTEDGEELLKLSVQSEIYCAGESSMIRKGRKMFKGLMDAPLATKTMLGNEAILDYFNVAFDPELLAKEGDSSKLFDGLVKFMRGGISVCYNKRTGRFRLADKPLENEFMIVYGFIGATNSGLRTGSIKFSAIKLVNDGLVTECDDRYKRIEETIGKEFTSALFDTYGNLKPIAKSKIFKIMTRMMIGSPASVTAGYSDNIAVFTKIAEKSVVNEEEMPDAFDGTCFMASDVLRREERFKRFSRMTLESKLFQDRCENAANKSSVSVRSQKFIRNLFEELVELGTTLQYVIYEGEKKNYNELTENEKRDFISKVEIVTDENALKLGVQGRMEMNVLKQAYASKSKLNTVINLMMASVDQKAALRIISAKVREEILSKFSSLGLNVETDGNGNVVSVDIKEGGEAKDDQRMVSLLAGLDPRRAMQLFPGAFKSELNTIVKGISNLITALNPKVDSDYLAVLPDIACIFGTRILEFSKAGEKEVFSPQLVDADYTSASRHPISGLNAVTTYKTVTLEDIIMKIAGSNMTRRQKEICVEFYRGIQGCAVIPASEYTKEKHDGLDYDIDAMVFIKDKDVVDILKRIPECGTQISDPNNSRKIMLRAEECIKNFHEKGDVALLLDVEEDNKALNKTVGKTKVESAFINAMARNKKANNTVGSFNEIFNCTISFYRSTVDPVGKIATSFYNNALLLSVMLDPKVPYAVKEAIAEAFRQYYGCTSQVEYVRVFNIEDFTIGLTKEKCIEAVYRFRKSNGSVNSVTLFLKDCCDANRFPAETSIDAVKNFYQTVNYFNHGKVIKAMGSDKAVTVKEKEDNNQFASIADALGTSTNNYFQVKMLEASTDKKGRKFLDVETIEEGLNFKEAAEDAGCCGVGVKDEFFKLKEELVLFANTAIVLAAKTVEEEVTSSEAQSYRDDVRERGASIDLKDCYRNPHKVCRSMNNIITTVFNIFAEKETVEEMDSRLYLREIATKRLVNTKNVAFKYGKNPLSNEEIGLVVISSLLEGNRNFNADPGFIHANVLKVFQDEILAFIKAEGIDTTLKSKAIWTDKKSIKLIEGESVAVVDGMGTTESGALVIFDDKKLNAEGVMVDGCINYNKEKLEGEAEYGIYLSAYGNADLFYNEKVADIYLTKGSFELVKARSKKKIDMIQVVNGKQRDGGTRLVDVRPGTLIVTANAKRVVNIEVGQMSKTTSVALTNLLDGDTDYSFAVRKFVRKNNENGAILLITAISERITNAINESVVNTKVEEPIVVNDESGEIFDIFGEVAEEIASFVPAMPVDSNEDVAVTSTEQTAGFGNIDEFDDLASFLA